MHMYFLKQNKTKYIFYFGKLEMIRYMTFLNKTFTSKFAGCLVFFAVNFSQGLF